MAIGEVAAGRRRGWWWAENAVFDFPVSGQARFVYLYLCRCSDDEAFSYPKMSTIGRATWLSTRAVCRALDELVRSGAVSVESGKSDGQPNRYTLRALGPRGASDDARCVYCDGPHEVWDHFLPKGAGGTNDRSNLVPACHGCNLVKGARVYADLEAARSDVCAQRGVRPSVAPPYDGESHRVRQAGAPGTTVWRTEGNPGKETKGRTGVVVLSDDQFLEKLRELYPGLDVAAELRKMDAWLLTPKGRRRTKTRAFVVNWLNKCDPPMPAASAGGPGATLRLADLPEDLREQVKIEMKIRPGTTAAEVLPIARRTLSAREAPKADRA